MKNINKFLNYDYLKLDRPSVKYNLDRHSLDSVDVFYNDSVINAIKLGVSKENAEDELKKSQELLIDLVNVIMRYEVHQKFRNNENILETNKSFLKNNFG